MKKKDLHFGDRKFLTKWKLDIEIVTLNNLRLTKKSSLGSNVFYDTMDLSSILKKYNKIQLINIIFVIFIFAYHQFQQIMNTTQQTTDHICIIKDRQIQSDQSIISQQKQARSRFFTHTIKDILSEAGATTKEQISATDLFVREQQYTHQIYLHKVGELAKYKKQIKQLKEILASIETEYGRKKVQCKPLQQIIKLKCKNLKAINIQYGMVRNSFYRYSISAFQIFKVIHDNKMLSQVTIKGVLVQQFQQFIQLINTINNKEAGQQRTALTWMKNFNPQKSLKLSINTQIKFYMQNKQKTNSMINNLTFFIDLFYWLSDITIVIELKFSEQTNEQINNLQNIWKCLKEIKKIKIQIWGNNQISTSQITEVRSSLFGGLASFTEIAQLSFVSVYFSPQIKNNDFLAIETILSNLFDNNKVTHLKIKYCVNLPIFPDIKNLQSIILNDVSFRKQNFFLSQITHLNPSLLSVQCIQISQQWIITDQLFNQLQTLIIESCSNITLGDITLTSSSSLKHLYIQKSLERTEGVIESLFPKLVNLTCLQIYNVNCGHQIICNIPSKHLQEIKIHGNNIITDHGLQAIDLKWPNIKNITLSNCGQVTIKLWNICRFKGLINLNIDRRMLGEGNNRNYILNLLKSRGIKFIYY